MTPTGFNAKYKEMGGYMQLNEMVNNAEPLSVIAIYFGVTKERVRQWIHELLGGETNLRAIRKERKIQNIVEFLQKHGKKEARKSFSGSTMRYFQEALHRYELQSLSSYKP